MSECLQKIAIIGATGNLGKWILKALLDQNKHTVTIITRTKPADILPSDRVKIEVGQYDDEAFMKAALTGQDVLILTLAFPALGMQDRLFEIAASAGVKYIMPSMYGLDSGKKEIREVVPLLQTGADHLEKIQQLGMGYFAVVTNLWIDYFIERDLVFNIAKKEATIFPDSGHFCCSTLAQVGRGIAAMLALPQATVENQYMNKYLYLNSFRLTHEDLFSAVLQATGTKETDWSVERKSTDTLLQDGRAKMASGDHSGLYELIYFSTFKQGLGGNYGDRLHTGMLGLPQEDLVEVISHALQSSGQEKAQLTGHDA